MKKEKRMFFGIATFALVIVLAACSNPSGPEGGEFSVSGKFTNGGKTSYFTAQKSDGGRAVAAQVPLSGTLDDGDFTLRLKGFYDEESDVFSLSATSSVIKYSISGTAEGSATASVATRASAAVPFNEPVFVEVSTEVSGADLADNIARGQETAVVAGLDLEDCEGVWYHELAPDQIKYIVSDWGITMAYNENNEWIDNGSIGFSEIDKTNGIDIVADFTAIEWVPPREPADFPAYLVSAEGGGYNVISRAVYEKLPQVMDHASLLLFLPDSDQYGNLAVSTTDGIYTVNIRYDTTGTFYGSPETPFVAHDIHKVGANGSLNLDDNAFATFEAAVDKAQAVLREIDTAADVWSLIPKEYNTKSFKLSAAVVKYREDHPYPADMTNQEEMDKWQTAFDAVIKEALHSYDPAAYPDVDKMIFPNSPEYFDMLTAWMDIPNFKTVTKYIKWNVSLVGGKLIMKAYYSGTPNTGDEAWYLDDPAYAKNSFTEAKALTTLPQQNQSTYDGSVTTMTR